MSVHEIFRWVGYFLLMLSGLSGFFLFVFAVAGSQKAKSSTLWGLFLFGLGAGLFLLIVPIR